MWVLTVNTIVPVVAGFCVAAADLLACLVIGSQPLAADELMTVDVLKYKKVFEPSLTIIKHG